jgi:hypothetical protein
MLQQSDASIVSASTKPASGSKPQRAKLGSVVPPFFPHPNVFIPQTMDVWTGSGTAPPPAGVPRLTAVPIGITGVWAEGHRTKAAASDAYTHVILTDPSTAILDPYKGNSQTLLQAGDALAIPAGQTSNWWLVVFSYVTNLAGVGRRRVILADRFGTPGNWAVLV